MDEILGLRSYTRKVFDLGGGRKLGRFHAGHIHFVDDVTGALEPVDHTWVDRGTYWEMTRASYRMRVAKNFGAANLIQYQNRYEGAAHDLVYEPHSLVWAAGRDLANVQVWKTQQSVQGVINGPTIRFANAFGSGLHFEVTLRGSGFTKELVIQRRNVLDPPPTAQHRLVLLSRYKPTGVTVKDSGGRQWDGVGEFDDANDDGFRLEEPSAKRSLIRPAYVVEGNEDETRHRCPVVWTNRNGAMWQAKVLPTAVLNNGTYPLRADTVTSYYAGAGDGYAEQGGVATWDLCHDGAGNVSDYTSTTTRVSVGNFASGYQIRRTFFPVDTSGIPDGDTITAATFYAKCSSVNNNNDNDGDDFFVLVGPTSQASNTVLANGDYDACGAIDSPQELTADRKDHSTFTAAAYASWAFDATGLGVINKTGYTLIGLREGHDVIDSSITGGVTPYDNQLRFYTSERAGTGDDPYLEVTYTASAAASGALPFPKGQARGMGLGIGMRYA